MTSQPGEQTVTIHLLPNISQSKDNQAMKFGQLTEYKETNFFFKYHTENEVGGLVLNLFSFFKELDIR